MASLSIPYPRGTVPTVLVQLETSAGRKIVGGEIDSGSDRSLCPLTLIGDLGLTMADLKKDEKRGMAAVGDPFDTWFPTVGVTGQIMVPGEEGFAPWGPMFPLSPVFADTESLLLGQKDFFAAFDLKFLNRPDGPTFEICECAPLPRGP